jgi:hypothetical protein
MSDGAPEGREQGAEDQRDDWDQMEDLAGRSGMFLIPGLAVSHAIRELLIKKGLATKEEIRESMNQVARGYLDQFGARWEEMAREAEEYRKRGADWYKEMPSVAGAKIAEALRAEHLEALSQEKEQRGPAPHG